MDWRELFTDRILQRGYDYYYEGAVEDIEVNGNTINATVFGSDDYDVEIEIEEDEISYMECTCPYAEDGHNCKHMVAVLLELENGNYEIENDSSTKINTEDEIKNIIKQANENQVQEFLYNVLSYDQKLFSRFKTFINPQEYPLDMQEYKRHMTSVIMKYVRRGNYIDDYQTLDFFLDMRQCIDDYIWPLLNSKLYENAFELSVFLLRGVFDINIDDSEGDSTYFIDSCKSVWNQIYANANKEIKDIMFAEIQQLLNEEFTIELDDFLMNYFMNNFHEVAYLLDKLKYIDHKIRDGEDYLKNYWVNLRLEVMKELNYPIIEIKEYCKMQWQYSETRNFYVSCCLSEENYSEAVSVLKESIEIDKDYNRRIDSYHRQLKDIYRKMGNMEEYKQELYNLIVDSKGNLSDYKELKNTYVSDDWIPIRNKLLSVLENNYIINELYIEEKLYDKLLSKVLESNNLEFIIRYTENLKHIYPRELLEKYKECLHREAIYVSNRSNYQRLVGALNKMQSIDGGEEVVQDIVNEWRLKYRNRRAMMDELNKLNRRL